MIGSAVGLFLTALVVVMWLTAFAVLNHSARDTVRQEAENVLAEIVTSAGTLAIDRYSWNEPHHRYKGRHVDPFFLQVFDTNGNLLRASENIEAFSDGNYPSEPLRATTLDDGLFDPLRTFRVDEQLLYFSTRPIYNDRGEQLGTIQIARRETGVQSWYWWLAGGLAGGLLVVLSILTGLIWWSAGRVLQPLENITRSARAISAERLTERIPVPVHADRETIQLTRTLNTLLDRLEQSFDEMRRFTASAAHELKTPLTVLRGHVDVALRRQREPEDYRQTLGLIRRKIDHLVTMVQSLLTLARLAQDEHEQTKKPVDIIPIIRHEVSHTRTAARNKGLDVRLETVDTAVVEGHEEMIRELLSNVLDNAVKYTDAGEITVRVRRLAEDLELRIADTGIGIEPEAIPHVADRFYRSRSADARGIDGSGLGLSLVQQIVDWHGGTFEIDSIPAEGTIVTIRLPLAPRDASPEPAERI